MTINQPNDAPDRLVFSCSGIFRSMEIFTDTDDYPYPTLAVRIHITLQMLECSHFGMCLRLSLQWLKHGVVSS